MVLPLIAGGVAGLGSLLGGRKRNKAAKNAERGSIIDRRDAVVMARQDQEEALRLAREDEARLRAATGYDLVKLRQDAEKAGFNPLTAFQFTGGAGYDGRGAVVMSPFISKADAFINMSGAVAGARGTVVDTAGYLGDAIGSAGSAFFTQLNADRQLSLDAARVSLARDELAMIAAPFGGGGGLRQTTSFPNSQAVSSPFFPGSVTKLGTIAKDWWNVVPEVAVDTLGIWQKYSRFGTTTVFPGGGPDIGSIASGAALEGLAKAKLRGYVPLDVERGLWERLSGAAAAGWGGLYRGAQWTSALMGRPPVAW